MGVEISFKDMCILAAVLTVDAEVSLGRIYEQVWAVFTSKFAPSDFV